MQFYKANRTGRWAGSIIQPQNLPQNHLKTLAEAREMVKAGDAKSVGALYDSVTDTLSQLIRTVIIAPEGMQLVVADFSAIEARVVAWLADEQWRMDVFRDGGDIYCASASQMFHVPVVKHGVNGELRQKGKIAELALGYGGSVGAMVSMGGSSLGLSDEEMQDIVKKWREASPNVVKLWWKLDKLAMDAMTYPGHVFNGPHGVWAERMTDSAMLRIGLPSGRALHYLRPRIIENKYGRPALSYEGNDGGKWGRGETFGGKLTENVVQAIARDCLCEAMKAITDLGYQIIFTVHDEAIVETDRPYSALKDMLTCMSKPIPWAPGLLLKGDGYYGRFYRKD
jgi:DNA polymerase